MSMGRSGWATTLACVVLGGGLHAASLSPWVGSGPPLAPAVLQTLALALLLWAMARQPRSAALTAWLYGAVWLVGATGWMFVSLHRYGGLPAWLSALAVGLLCMALAGYLALLGWAWGRWRTAVWWRDAVLFAGLWLLAELARALIFTGFPWGASGYGLVDSPLRHLAPWLGVYGMGAVWALLCACAVWGFVAGGAGWRRGAAVLWIPLAVWALDAAGTHPFTHPQGAPLNVALLQSNVAQDEKFQADYQLPMLLWHARALLSTPGDLVVAPETAIPLLPSQLPEGYWRQLQQGVAQVGRHALVGVPLGDFNAGYTNSVAGFSPEALRLPDGQYRYDKHHLVPFGEFIPFGFHWFVRMMNMPLGDFSRGPLAAPSFPVHEQRVAPTICYEDLFGEEIASRFADPASAPTILANVSNLAWFGERVAIYQHQQIARVRSLEFQLPTIRATNTGATMAIDQAGQVTASLAPNTRGVLQAQVQGMTGVTPFAWWAARWGLWPLVLLGVFMVLFSGRVVQRGVETTPAVE